MKIIVGLGNPGEKYKKTRHNAGFMVVDALAQELDLTWQKNKKFNAEVAKGADVILVKPLTFMNNSGWAVQAVLNFYSRTPSPSQGEGCGEVLTVIHDDLDIDLGKYKISSDSRSAGHNGVQSIINHLKTKNFKRIRIGVRAEINQKVPAERPARRRDGFVLQNFSKEELDIVDDLIEEIIEAIKNDKNAKRSF